MKKILASLIFLLTSSLITFGADMRFKQVDGLLYNSQNQQEFDKLINKINQEKKVEFIVFTGNNIARPDSKELKNFLKNTKKYNNFTALSVNSTSKEENSLHI